MLFRKKSREGDSHSDWVTDLSKTIERAIDQIREKAVVPLTTIARGLVYGLLAAIVGTTALIIFTIAFIRFLFIYISNIPGAPQGIWLTDLMAGAIFVLIGLFLWNKSKSHVRTSEK